MNFKKVMNYSSNLVYNAKEEKHIQCILALNIHIASTHNIKKGKENKFIIKSHLGFSYIIDCTYCII